MTANQIRYADVRRQQRADEETARSHRVYEGLEARKTKSQETFQERQGTASLQQAQAATSQAAAAHRNASANYLSAQASMRHAGAAEMSASAAVLNAQTNQSNLAETIRSHMAQESLTQSAQNETNRHNLVAESLEDTRNMETHRSNLQREQIDRYANDIKSDANDIMHQYNLGRLSNEKASLEIRQQLADLEAVRVKIAQGQLEIDESNLTLRTIDTVLNQLRSWLKFLGGKGDE